MQTDTSMYFDVCKDIHTVSSLHFAFKYYGSQIIVGNKPQKHTHTHTGFTDMIGQKPGPGTHWKLLGMPMSALVSFFFLPLLFSLRLRMLLRWYGCWVL